MKQFSIKKKKQQQLNFATSSVGCKNTPLQGNTIHKAIKEHLFKKKEKVNPWVFTTASLG